MYRLLVVTKSPDVEEMFLSIDGWEAMGYKPVRVRGSVQEALACMQKHHIDAIAISDDEDFLPLYEYLDEHAPNMPIFPIEENKESQLVVLREVSQLLSRLHADDSNDDYDESYYFRLARDGWMKRLMSGLETTRKSICEQHRMLRCKDALNQPCVLISLSIAQGDPFISDRWHYGSERLETALRNFFGMEHGQTLIHVAVVSPEEVCVLACPCGTDAQVVLENELAYVKETVEQIDNYLGLSMTIEDARTLNGLIAFAQEN